MKQEIGGWINENWDHGFIYVKNNHEMEVTLNMIESHKMYAHPYNPTGENLARYLQTVAAPNIMKYIGIFKNKVAVWET